MGRFHDLQVGITDVSGAIELHSFDIPREYWAVPSDAIALEQGEVSIVEPGTLINLQSHEIERPATVNHLFFPSKGYVRGPAIMSEKISITKSQIKKRAFAYSYYQMAVPSMILMSVTTILILLAVAYESGRLNAHPAMIYLITPAAASVMAALVALLAVPLVLLNEDPLRRRLNKRPQDSVYYILSGPIPKPKQYHRPRFDDEAE
jgi:hypothetical protein